MRYLAILPFLAFTAALAAAADPADKQEKVPAVTIKNMQFTPASLTIKVGQTVTWTNADDRDHTVVSSDGGKTFKSENISNKGTFKQKFDKKGKYTYSCSYHPRMKGTIVVEE
jgi:plastocyanin